MSCPTHGIRFPSSAIGTQYRCGEHGPYDSYCPECVRWEERRRCLGIVDFYVNREIKPDIIRMIRDGK